MNNRILLSRSAFREGVFQRDGYRCVVCKAPAVDAHHIIERRLFSDGGYYLDNGASVCEEHHLAAESTLLSCDELRLLCGIGIVLLPPHFYCDGCGNHPIDGDNYAKKGSETRSTLYTVQSSGSHTVRQQRPSETLPEDMRSSLQLSPYSRSGPSECDKERASHRGRVCDDTGPEANICEARESVCSGAPDGDGAKIRSISRSDRRRSSPERDKGRQSTGEPRVDSDRRISRDVDDDQNTSETHKGTGGENSRTGEWKYSAGRCLNKSTCTKYDKWGNIIHPDGTRSPGELFHDESVQKVIAPVLHLFTWQVKYPRTHHLPWSPGTTDDDRVLSSVTQFRDQEVVVTEKMDGEQTTMYRDFIHARSLSGGSHPSRTWVRSIHGRIAHEIPEGWRVCGENLQAKHSIYYEALPSYFMVFAIFDRRGTCLSWDETEEWAALLDLHTVPVLYRGPYDKAKVTWCWTGESVHGGEQEGYVLRVARAFKASEFKTLVGKYVRADHVQTVAHNWLRQEIVPNRLKGA